MSKLEDSFKVLFKTIFHDFIPGFGITVFLAFAYILNLVWIISCELTLPLRGTFLSLYIAIYIIFLIILNLISSFLARFLMLTTQFFRGAGSFSQTRQAILYALIALLPVNVMSCILQFVFQQPNQKEWIFLRLIAYFISIFSLLLAFIFLVQKIAKCHRINKFYAFISVLMSIIITVLISQVLFWLKHYRN